MIVRKSILALTAAATLGTAALIPAEASARWRPEYGWGAAAVAGGVLAGAAIANAQPRYYGPPPVAYYDSPAYVEAAPQCWMERRRVWVEGVGWTRQRVRVCD